MTFIVLALRYIIVPVAIIVIVLLVWRYKVKSKAAKDVIDVKPITVKNSDDTNDA